MSKKTLTIIGYLALASAWIMRIVGGKSSHLSELRQYWWAPLILSLVCFIVATKKTQ